jgi:hypothetical protein
MSSGKDFIPLSSDKGGKKRKKDDDDRRHHSGNKSADRGGPDLARCPKLKERICKYLEVNRNEVSGTSPVPESLVNFQDKKLSRHFTT